MKKTRILICALFVLIFFNYALAQKSGDREERMYSKAIESYNNGRYEEAITNLDNFLKMYPGSSYSANAKYCLDQAKLKLEKENENKSRTPAGSRFDQIQKDKRDQISGLYTRVIQLFNNGEYEETVKICQAILVLDPKHDKASEYFKRANTEINKKEALGHLKNGEDLASKGKILEASAEWQLALASNPDDLQLKNDIETAKLKIILEHSKKAMDLLNEDKVVESMAEWNIVLAVDPYNVTGKKGIEAANAKLKNLKKEERDSLNYESLMKKGNDIYEQKDYLGAIDFYQQALALKPTEALSNKIKETRVLIAKSVKKSLEDAKTFTIEKNWVLAVKSWRACLKNDPQNQEAYNGLKEYQNEIKELRDKVYLEGLEAYGKDDMSLAISKWQDVLILDPQYEKAQLNIEKASRKKQK